MTTTDEEYETLIRTQQLDIINLRNKLQHDRIKLHVCLLSNLMIWGAFGKWRIGGSIYLLTIAVQ